MSFHNGFFHHNLQFSRSFTKKLNEQLAKVNLFHSQWLIIYYLNQYGCSTLVEISNYLDVEKPTVTRTVNRLEERKLIEQIPGKDKRERRIQLTESGEITYQEAKKVVEEFELQLMSGLAEEDRETTLRTLLFLKGKLK
ncbi:MULTISPECIES: MarR family winged helix-turn-helix transcriptional regulator [unclassified Peribacillus]|uniref:MarR family winged helix-turn-helix transcriptional regulator n=1 Tax=unclassified Peribacillus TaxID=2675266 RepID=UPI0019134AFE|nr:MULTISPECIES: MarR family transcriptional regulator [unclassified Peribacillus]MBK5444136.1 MarR family transcriptional regulator [Peribacillus sp. TH24]MBK5461144.1 MarR family transcriptional regulator [Peribacillus sp. TH27]MBK5485535.1 MarR family transcriptional regulator [Peribacillus sp. TH16]MBK5499286.1 MarR family transcriptional regulator [Peribacillus sp. TH14]WMX55614.1 MarR family transcriptional regulator [Peribacillus sp. R9-11]